MKCVVRVVEARGIKAADLNGKSDPYVKLSIRGSNQPVQRTRTLYKTLSPIWNEEFTFQNVRPNDVLELRLWDYDVATSDDALGQLDIPLSTYVNSMKDEWKPVLEKRRGLKSHFTQQFLGTPNMKAGGEIHLSIWVGNGSPQQAQPYGVNQTSQSVPMINQQYPSSYTQPQQPLQQPLQQPPQQYGQAAYGAAPLQNAQNPGQYPQNTYGTANAPGLINYGGAQQTSGLGAKPLQSTQQYPQPATSQPPWPTAAPQQQQQSYAQPPWPTAAPQQQYPPQQQYSAPVQQTQNYPGQYPQNTYGTTNAPGLINYGGAQQTAGLGYPNRDMSSASFDVSSSNLSGSQQFPDSWGPKPLPPSALQSTPSSYGAF